MSKRIATYIAVMILSVLCVTTAWAASQQSEYTCELFYGTPGHKGEPAHGTFELDERGWPKAFFADGHRWQEQNLWLCIDVYRNGAFQETCWYYFPEGNFVEQRWKQIGGKYYYLSDRGAITGWMKWNGEYYYLDPNEYYMWTSGNVERDGKMYTIGKDGMARPVSEIGYSSSIVEGNSNSGWAQENGKWYCLRDGSRICSEWIRDGEKWYYAGADGYLYVGTREVDGVVYDFGGGGSIRTNTECYYNGQKYLLGADGKGVPVEMTQEERIDHSRTVIWMETTYAIYEMDLQAAILMGADYEVAEVLRTDWGITNREEGLAVIDGLVQSAKNGDKTSKAWNYSRAMLLCDSLYKAGYISMEERPERQFAIAPSIQKDFTSWDDFNEHYLNGFSEWANATGCGYLGPQRRSWYTYLKKMGSNPFKRDWNQKLEKDW